MRIHPELYQRAQEDESELAQRLVGLIDELAPCDLILSVKDEYLEDLLRNEEITAEQYAELGVVEQESVYMDEDDIPEVCDDE